MQIILTEKERLDILHTALCNSGHIMYGTMGLIYDTEGYKKARQELQAEKPTEELSREDIWVKMVSSGMRLLIQDSEMGERWRITLGRLQIIDTLPIHILSQFIQEEDDADTADWVLEYITHGEKIYG